MSLRDDLDCRRILWRQSKSFAAAALLLPPRAQGPTAALYAFCRVSDDAVDAAGATPETLVDLHARLDAAYAGAPREHPVDRAFARAVREHRIPRVVPEALLEGYAWDLSGRRYETLEALRAYCARVASTVGVMMTLVLGRREPTTLGRACDLGVAMQLTNVARDVGEDALGGRLYLPAAWLREEGVDPDAFLAAPRFSPGLGRVVARMLEEAERLYVRAERGIPRLPRDGRLAVAAARYIYADIGREIARAGHDSITRRAFTSRARKLGLIARSLPWLLRSPAPDDAPPLPETEFLVRAAMSRDACGRGA